jgi:hypothetical protein
VGGQVTKQHQHYDFDTRFVNPCTWAAAQQDEASCEGWLKIHELGDDDGKAGEDGVLAHKPQQLHINTRSPLYACVKMNEMMARAFFIALQRPAPSALCPHRAAQQRTMGIGLAAHLRKSSVVKLSPIASISTPTPNSNCCVVIQLSVAGRRKAVVPEMRACAGSIECTHGRGGCGKQGKTLEPHCFFFSLTHTGNSMVATSATRSSLVGPGRAPPAEPAAADTSTVKGIGHRCLQDGGGGGMAGDE